MLLFLPSHLLLRYHNKTTEMNYALFNHYMFHYSVGNVITQLCTVHEIFTDRYSHFIPLSNTLHTNQ